MINFTKTIGLVILIVWSLPNMAQEIIPIEQESSYFNSLSNDEEPQNIYFKDINHMLNKYMGTWTGTYKDKTYEIKIDDVLKTQSDPLWNAIKYDNLIARYRITDASGTVIKNTFNLSDQSPEVLEGLGYDKKKKGIYTLIYIGENTKCGNSGTIYLDINSAHTQLKLHILPDDVLISDEDCPSGYQKPPFPDEDETPMVLTKRK